MPYVSNKKFKEAVQNKDYIRIMKRICSKNLSTVCSLDEINTLMMNTLWKCLLQYDDTEKAKFTSYLYRSMSNNSVRLYKKKIKIQNSEKFFNESIHSEDRDKTQAKREAWEFLESLKDIDEELYEIIIDKYFYQMTYREIGKKNGYTNENARKKVKKALKICRKMCIDK